MKIEQGLLLTGSDIAIENVGTVRPPRVRDIMSQNVGERRYSEYLGVLSQTIRGIIGNDANFAKTYENMTEAQKSECSLFRIMTKGSPVILGILHEALSFFFVEELRWDPRAECFHIGDTKRVIDAKNYAEVCSVIQTVSCVKVTHDSGTLKFRNEKARRIYERCKAEKEKAERASGKKDGAPLSYANMAAAVAAKSHGYNLLNVWDLTVYQLRDQFIRINLNYQTEMYGQKWAAWGTEPFDFSTWYKDINQDKE